MRWIHERQGARIFVRAIAFQFDAVMFRRVEELRIWRQAFVVNWVHFGVSIELHGRGLAGFETRDLLVSILSWADRCGVSLLLLTMFIFLPSSLIWRRDVESTVSCVSKLETSTGGCFVPLSGTFFFLIVIHLHHGSPGEIERRGVHPTTRNIAVRRWLNGKEQSIRIVKLPSRIDFPLAVLA